MKLIINTSNLYGGGGIQVGFSFIHECLKFTENEYHVFLCPLLSAQIDKNKFPSNYFFYEFKNTPSPFLKGITTIKKLELLELKIKPDCVFSIFGPTYWTPKSPHLMGYAIPHFLYPESPFFNKISFIQKVKWSLMKILKRYYFKDNADYYHVETEDSRMRLARYLNTSINKVFTVSNTYSSTYENILTDPVKILPQRKNNEFRLVCISTYYPHKNLEILNEIIPCLKKIGILNVKFILTLKDEIFKSVFIKAVQSQIINVGPISILDCPRLYSESDVMFLPTLLECFSANYPEAMKMNKPILTSDLSFAHEVCGNAALYFDPLNKIDVIEKIKLLIDSKYIRDQLIKNGETQLLKFSSAKERAEKYLDICKMIIRK